MPRWCLPVACLPWFVWLAPKSGFDGSTEQCPRFFWVRFAAPVAKSLKLGRHRGPGNFPFSGRHCALSFQHFMSRPGKRFGVCVYINDVDDEIMICDAPALPSGLDMDPLAVDAEINVSPICPRGGNGLMGTVVREVICTDGRCGGERGRTG